MSDRMAQNLHITKWQILVKSSCLAKLISSFCALIVCLVVFNSKCIATRNQTTIEILVGSIALSLSFLFAAILLKKILLAIKICAGKYNVVKLKVFAIKKRHVVKRNGEKILELENLRITVEKHIISRFSIGDEAILIFADGVEYPILIANTKDLC